MSEPKSYWMDIVKEAVGTKGDILAAAKGTGGNSYRAIVLVHRPANDARPGALVVWGVNLDDRACHSGDYLHHPISLDRVMWAAHREFAKRMARIQGCP